MKSLKNLLIITLLISSNSITAQNYYDIKNPGAEYVKRCQSCVDLIKNKPREIQFGIRQDEFNNLYFVVNSQDWFDLMFKKKWDGLAVDIVDRELYDCSKKSSNTSMLKGVLQRPIYSADLKQNSTQSEFGEFVAKIGKLPREFRDREVEFNILFLKDRYLCYYNSFYDIKSYRWDLLDMGLFFDSLVYKNELDTNFKAKNGQLLKDKELKFEIPFEKNKSVYSKDDIKPMYDSLELTDYTIVDIDIHAYSSIEGSEEINLQLQKDRAQSIVTSLQSFQQPYISTDIRASENWVDFLNDLPKTAYSSWASLSKSEIKQKLEDPLISEELEPYLQRHRKAIVNLHLQRIDKYKDMSTEELIEVFSVSIKDKDLEKAKEIQNSIFEKIKNHDTPTDLVDQLEIPKKKEFSLLLNKNSTFKYLMDPNEIEETFDELNELNYLIPNDAHIRYNICAIKFQLWLMGNQTVVPENFKKEIMALKPLGIQPKLVKRMLINYEIICSELYMYQGEYAKKDKSLKFISSNYKHVPKSNQDLLSLAQYFASYARYDWATKLLQEKVKEVDVDEDLLFYYLNLTLIDEDITKRADYRTIMLNAINLNRLRYCELFNAFGKGGITFQLLENIYLKDTYCENCLQTGY